MVKSFFTRHQKHIQTYTRASIYSISRHGTLFVFLGGDESYFINSNLFIMTKKILLLTAIFWLAAVFFAFAQDDSEENEYLKPDYGMLTAEYQFSPLSPNPLSIENLRLRYFIDYNLALRAGLTLDYQNDSPTDSLSLNGFRTGLRAGLEFHFPGTKRLSPYWGFELQFLSQGYNAEETDDGDVTEVRGQQVDALGNFGERGYFSFGGTALLGFDLYLAKNFYMGAELGLSANSRSFKDTEVTFNGTSSIIQTGGNEFRLGINANNLIRIGYAF